MAPNRMPALINKRRAANDEGGRFDIAGTPMSPRSIEGSTRRKRAVATSATTQTASSRNDLAIDRHVHADGRTSLEIMSLKAPRHNDMKRNELQSASRKPTVSHPLLDEERAQRSISSDT